MTDATSKNLKNLLKDFYVYITQHHIFYKSHTMEKFDQLVLTQQVRERCQTVG